MRIRAILGGLVLAAAAAGGSLLAVSPAQAAASTVVCDVVVEVQEADWDVYTGCDLEHADRVVISASGLIWAGVWFTGQNGPQGWTNIANDPKFPMPSARAYSLLAKTDGRYRPAGTGTAFNYTGAGSPLHLRINDDTPGNGNGAFVATVKVTRIA
jgi:hypothetical protein